MHNFIYIYNVNKLLTKFLRSRKGSVGEIAANNNIVYKQFLTKIYTAKKSSFLYNIFFYHILIGDHMHIFKCIKFIKLKGNIYL